MNGMKVISTVLLILAAFGFISCGAGPRFGPESLPPLDETLGDRNCLEPDDVNSPWLVGLDATDRGSVAQTVNKGVMLVEQGECGTFKMLPDCYVPGTAYEENMSDRPRADAVEITNHTLLQRKVPMAVAKYSRAMQSEDHWSLDFVQAGEKSFNGQLPKIDWTKVRGTCKRATHYVYNVTLGAYQLSVAQSAEIQTDGYVGPTDWQTRAARKKIEKSEDGDYETCASGSNASGSDTSGSDTSDSDASDSDASDSDASDSDASDSDASDSDASDSDASDSDASDSDASGSDTSGSDTSSSACKGIIKIWVEPIPAALLPPKQPSSSVIGPERPSDDDRNKSAMEISAAAEWSPVVKYISVPDRKIRKKTRRLDDFMNNHPKTSYAELASKTIDAFNRWPTVYESAVDPLLNQKEKADKLKGYINSFPVPDLKKELTLAINPLLQNNGIRNIYNLNYIKPPRNQRRILGHVALWPGIVLAAGGGGATVMAKMYGDKFCSNYRYDKSNCEKSETWAAVMWVSYGLGAALITTGIVMLVSASKQERAVRRRISWTPLLGNHNVALAISGRW